MVLTTLYESLKKDELHVHVGSWASIEPRFREIEGEVQEVNHSTKEPLKLHPAPLRSQVAQFDVASPGVGLHAMQHSAGTRGLSAAWTKAPKVLTTHSPNEYIHFLEFFGNLIDQINPVTVVADHFLFPALDASRLRKRL